MLNEIEVNGSCHCGKIKISAIINKSEVRVCHCTDCQIMSGAPLRAIAPVTENKIEITGKPKEYIKIADSGNKRIQAFCENCGTQLFATDSERRLFNLRTGFLEQRHLLEPHEHVFLESSVLWLKKVNYNIN